MKIVVTGAAGFLGSRVVELARRRGHEVRAFVRRSDDPSVLHLPPDSIVIGDLTQRETLAPATQGADAIIHCAATTSEGAPDWELSRRTNVEGTRSLLHAAESAGRPRWIQISSMSAHAESTSAYGKTKFEADQLVRACALSWTILQPSIIYGPGGKGLVGKTLGIMRKVPVLPVVGSGKELLRPVHVDDVAGAALDCLTHPQTAGKTYMIGGADEITFDEFLKEIARASGIRRPTIHIPISFALVIARVLGVVTKNPPITVDNVLGIKQARRVLIDGAISDFNFQPRKFAEGLKDSFGGAQSTTRGS
ncbi:NAD-dependent epimerase/dehydratase family protein [Candidatus Sumerlaeota bacterium]|nr:NAD-dependent epimerase/dehydratase family protein [Candidatus Sumerlaeota bacterium]